MKAGQITIISILLVEILSLFCFFYPAFSLPVLAVIFISALILFIKKPEISFYVVGAELVIGSFGRLIAHSVSLRMVLFGASMIAWIIDEIRHYKTQEKLRVPLPIILLLGLVVLQSLHGYLLNQSITSIINDANNYFFFLLALPFIRYRKKINNEVAKNIFFVAVAWLSFKTLLIFVIFTHLPQPFFDTWIYHWIRDTRMGEITGYGQGLVRVFFQSHIFAAVALVVLFSKKLFSEPKQMVLLVLSFTTLLLSLSRSIWIGVAFGLMTRVIYKIYKKNLLWLDVRRMLLSCIGAVALISVLYYLPIGTRTSAPLYRLFTIRAENLSGETAALSRWQQLPLLWNAITQKPFIGYGFGSSLVIGTVPKSSFEWGWLDLWFKMGIAGVIIYLGIIYSIAKNTTHTEFIVPLLIVLVVTHTFTPYLNHPLGVGILLGLFLDEFLATT